MTAMTGLKPAVRRLMRDWRELQSDPVPGVSAEPLSWCDLFNWHANLTPAEGPFYGTVVHIKLEFTDSYPATSPVIVLSVGVPTNKDHRLRANPRRDGFSDIDACCGAGFWSSAYTLRSLLQQLVCTLFDVPPEAKSRVEPCLKMMRDFCCSECGHTYANPYPVPNLHTRFANPLSGVWALNPTHSQPRHRQSSKPVGSGNERFGSMATDALKIVMDFLALDDVLAAMRVCRRLRDIERRFSLRASLQHVCFYRKTSFRDDILGSGFYKLSYSSTGLKKSLDYRAVDLLSRGAFFEDNVRCGTKNERYTHWMPRLLNGSNADQVWRYADRAIFEVHHGFTPDDRLRGKYVGVIALHAAQWSIGGWPDGGGPSATLDVLGRLMNSCVRTFYRGGLSYDGTTTGYAAERALAGYCALHHLLVGYALRPDCAIVAEARNSVQRFMTSREGRDKKTVPSLGAWLPRLLIAGVPWSCVAAAFVDELLTRRVRGSIEASCELGSENVKWSTSAVCFRLQRGFRINNSRLHLLLLQTLFLSLVQPQKPTPAPNRNTTAVVANSTIGMVANNTNMSKADGGMESLRATYGMYNAEFGRPSASAIRRLRAACRSACNETVWVGSYEQFFERLGLGRIHPNQIYQYLEKAVVQSRERAYHSPQRIVMLRHQQRYGGCFACVCGGEFNPRTRDARPRPVCRYAKLQPPLTKPPLTSPQKPTHAMPSPKTLSTIPSCDIATPSSLPLVRSGILRSVWKPLPPAPPGGPVFYPPPPVSSPAKRDERSRDVRSWAQVRSAPPRPRSRSPPRPPALQKRCQPKPVAEPRTGALRPVSKDGWTIVTRRRK